MKKIIGLFLFALFAFQVQAHASYRFNPFTGKPDYYEAGAGTSVITSTTPTVNQTSTGPKSNAFLAAGSSTVMDLVYLNSSSRWVSADATTAATSGGVMLAVSLQSKTVGQAMNVALPGSFVRNDAWSWTPGGAIYVSTTAAGLTQVQPSATDQVIRVVGYALDADNIYFNPSPDYITHV